MSVPCIFKRGRVSFMLQIWHLSFMHFRCRYCWCSGDCCLDEYLFNVGRLSLCAESCAAEQVFGGRHVAVAFPFFHNSFVSGDNGRMVCLFFDACCLCFKSTFRGIYTYTYIC